MRIKVIPDRAQSAMTDLMEKREVGEHVLNTVEFASKYKKTMEREPLDAAMLETLMTDIRRAVKEISRAGIAFNDECQGRRATLPRCNAGLV